MTKKDSEMSLGSEIGLGGLKKNIKKLTPQRSNTFSNSKLSASRLEETKVDLYAPEFKGITEVSNHNQEHSLSTNKTDRVVPVEMVDTNNTQHTLKSETGE